MKNSFLFVVLTLGLVSCLIIPLYFEGYVPIDDGTPLKRFYSYEHLRSFLIEKTQPYRYYQYYSWGSSRYLLMPTTSTQNKEMLAEAYGSSPDYSKTNIQVEGVDEADIVKTDGEYIYIVSGRNITILKAYPPEEAEILSQITLNGTVSGLFINENKMVVFESTYNDYIYYETFDLFKVYPYSITSDVSCIRLYDISNRCNPVSRTNVTISGRHLGSRMIGDYVYAVINEHVYVGQSWVSLPIISYNGKVQGIDATQIYYLDGSSSFDIYTTIIAINTQDDTEEPIHKTILLGSSSIMYVSTNNIYITFQESYEVIKQTATASIRQSLWGTAIHRISINRSEIEHVASGFVPGTVLNQFSMDEYNGYFRIATITSGSQNNVYVLDMDLNITGRLENFAPPSEVMDSARFIGNRCYLTTSVRRRDPFFVIDLENVAAPEVLGYLKIPGFTSYLHPYDENHVIGVGKDGNVVKISLFDVSNVSKPIEIDKYTISGIWSDTPVLREHKAFLFSKIKNLLAFPVSMSVYSWDAPSLWQGVYVFNMTLPEGFVLRGKITHSEEVKRSLYIDNVLYTISSKKIKMNSLEDLAKINEIELP